MQLLMASPVPTPSSRAFTLVELLIVVAIIAILAAIAVPNFLEAQVRARISQAHAGLRTTAVALEAWRVDYNSYPSRSASQFQILEALIPLSTPVPYVAEIPADPFVANLPASYSDGVDWNLAYKNHLGEWTFPRPFDYLPRLPNALWASVTSHPESARWALRSAGPDIVPTWLGHGAPAYDPTNGTVSAGDIYFTGPGIGLDQPAVPLL